MKVRALGPTLKRNWTRMKSRSVTPKAPVSKVLRNEMPVAARKRPLMAKE
jgi:hypothetical protein